MVDRTRRIGAEEVIIIGHPRSTKIPADGGTDWLMPCEAGPLTVYLEDTVNLNSSGCDKAHEEAKHTNPYFQAATPVTSAQV